MQRMEPITGRYVYVPYEGIEYRIYFEESGQGIPLVCLHTAGTHGQEYRHQMNDPEITKNFRVIAFDLPRHGKSIPPGDWYKEEKPYQLTSKFYCEFIMEFCKAIDLKNPVIMGSSMGGNVCLDLALNFDKEIKALISLSGADYTPGWYVDCLWHPHLNAGEVSANLIFGMCAPQSPAAYRWEVWHYYSQCAPGVFKGDLWYYSVTHDFREKCDKISGKVPLYFITGEYDFACTPEMSIASAKKIKNAEASIMKECGHFSMSENPAKFKEYLMPVLNKILKVNYVPAKAGSLNVG